MRESYREHAHNFKNYLKAPFKRFGNISESNISALELDNERLKRTSLMSIFNLSQIFSLEGDFESIRKKIDVMLLFKPNKLSDYYTRQKLCAVVCAYLAMYVSSYRLANTSKLTPEDTANACLAVYFIQKCAKKINSNSRIKNEIFDFLYTAKKDPILRQVLTIRPEKGRLNRFFSYIKSILFSPRKVNSSEIKKYNKRYSAFSALCGRLSRDTRIAVANNAMYSTNDRDNVQARILDNIQREYNRIMAHYAPTKWSSIHSETLAWLEGVKTQFLKLKHDALVIVERSETIPLTPLVPLQEPNEQPSQALVLSNLPRESSPTQLPELVENPLSILAENDNQRIDVLYAAYLTRISNTYDKAALDKIFDDLTQETKKLYHAFALRYHPDKNPNNIEVSKELFSTLTTKIQKIRGLLYGVAIVNDYSNDNFEQDFVDHVDVNDTLAEVERGIVDIFIRLRALRIQNEKNHKNLMACNREICEIIKKMIDNNNEDRAEMRRVSDYYDKIISDLTIRVSEFIATVDKLTARHEAFERSKNFTGLMPKTTQSKTRPGKLVISSGAHMSSISISKPQETAAVTTEATIEQDSKGKPTQGSNTGFFKPNQITRRHSEADLNAPIPPKQLLNAKPSHSQPLRRGSF